MKAQDLTGAQFGSLTACGFLRAEAGKRIWSAVCVCGKRVEVRGEALVSGNTSSCGCLRVELARSLKLRHGEARKENRTAEYKTWKGMINRCHCPTSSTYFKYGALGVSVCARWRDSFESFVSDMGRKPSPAMSIDRINPYGDYEPENCRWATASQQAKNKRVKS